MTLTQLLAELTPALTQAGIEGAARDMRRLAAHVIGVAPDRLTLYAHEKLEAGQVQALTDMSKARAEGRPVSRLIGKRLFWGRWFEISDDVLDPRPETEILIEHALSLAAPATVLDLGTGSGAIAVTLAAEWKQAQITATDLSKPALAIAAANAEQIGVADRVSLVQSDWYASVTGEFDLIISNPPYIAASEMDALAPDVRDHDPRMALTDEGDGLGAYRQIVAGVDPHLLPGGHLLVEIGWQQSEDVTALFETAGFANVICLRDMDGRDRAICGQKPVL